MDALSDLLQAMRLTGGVFLESRFTAPWSVVSRLRAEDYKAFLAVPNPPRLPRRRDIPKGGVRER